MKSKDITQIALFTALVFISTKLINIPTAIGGVINLSDSIILTISLISTRYKATIASGLGSFIAEVFSPYAVFAPATLIIKSSMAFVANTIFNSKIILNETVKIIIAFICAELIMILGYFIFQAFFLNLGVYTASLDIVNNIIQASASIVISLSLYKAITKVFKAQ